MAHRQRAARPRYHVIGDHPTERDTVAIIGGGVAGCATAISLSARGVTDMVVVDVGEPPAFRVGETIPPPTGLILRRLGLWDGFVAQNHAPCPGSAASWGKDELGRNDFVFDPHGHGWHLDRARFDAMVAERAAARGAPFHRGWRLTGVGPAADGAHLLTLTDDGGRIRHVTTDFLVDATGVAAGAARRLGVARNEVDSLPVLHAVFDLTRPDDIPTTTVMEGAEIGWWYAAKLPNARMIVALSTDREEMAERNLNDPAAWRRALDSTRHVAPFLERAAPTTPVPAEIATAVASSAILSRVVGRNWLAVGDSASSYDPITAQGIIKALSDGELAGAAIADALRDGSETPLSAYQDGVFARFTHYLRLRRDLYGRERRWPEAGFWRRRPLV